MAAGCLDTITGAARFIAFNAPFALRKTFCCQRSQIPNLIQVSERLFRGGQPNKEGLQTLCEKHQVSTVVNLRVTDTNKPLLEGLSIQSRCVYFDPDTGKHDPVVARETARKAAIEFLKIMKDPNAGVVYLHCYYGKERTGTLVAIERMVLEGWSAEQAIAELRSDPGFHEARHPQLVEFIRNFDIEAAKSELKIN